MGVGSGMVFVLDGEPDTTQKLTTSLSNSGFEVTTHTASGDLLTQTTKNFPDLVLLPVSRDIDRASQVIKDLRSRSDDLPIVLVMSESNIEPLAGLLEDGATNYLILPHATAELISHIARTSIDVRRELRRYKRNEKDLKKLNQALIESVRALEQDQQAGFRVQQGMMPESPFSTDGLTLRHLIVPSLILSGDFIDYFELPDGRLVFYIADVSGHGAQGAIVTVLLKGLSARLANEFDELQLDDAGKVLGWFNQELIACRLEQHVTMFLGIVDKGAGRLHYANAAHFPATILQSAQGTKYLEMGGLPLGLYEGARYSGRETALPESFTMVMFSDGVFEILPEQSLQAKEDHLLSLVKGDNGDIDSMADHLGLGVVNEVPDDIAVFTVARAG